MSVFKCIQIYLFIAPVCVCDIHFDYVLEICVPYERWVRAVEQSKCEKNIVELRLVEQKR